MGPSLWLAEGYKKIPAHPNVRPGSTSFPTCFQQGELPTISQAAQGARRYARAVGTKSACGFERSKIGVWQQAVGLKRPERLPAQFQHVSVVTCSVALASRPFSFREPSAELVPLAVVIAQSVYLFTAGTADRLLVWKRINLYGSAVDDFG
jgi:hypothetical protein